MTERLIIEETTVYEIDEECAFEKKKVEQTKEEQKKKAGKQLKEKK